MQEIIFYVDDYETLIAEAKRLGFTQDDAEGNPQVVVSAALPDGGAYFFNYVGKVCEPAPPGGYSSDNSPPEPTFIPGVWARLRVNGEVEAMPQFSDSITRYAYSPKAERWVDVVTREFVPDWIGDIGMIA